MRVRDAGILALTLVGIAFVGCGGDDGVSSDAGGVGPDAGAELMPAAPALPAGFTQAPCPEGWREVSDADIGTVCDPWPETGPVDCGDGEAHFPGGTGCEPIGTACPGGDFPEGLPADEVVVYVLAGAPPGDGTVAAPRRTIADSLAAAPPAAVHALGRGTYDERVESSSSATLWGACVSDTLLTSSETDEGLETVDIRGGRVELRNLRVGETRLGGIGCAFAGTELRLEEVVIQRATGGGILVVFDATMVGERLAIRDTRPLSTGFEGRAINVLDGATAEISRAVFERNHRTAALVNTDATLWLDDVAIRGTLPRTLDGLGGRGVGVQAGSSATLARVALEDNSDVALLVDEGSSLEVRHATVRDTGADVGGVGSGLVTQHGSTVEMSDVVVDRSEGVGVGAADEGTSVQLNRTLVRETRIAALPRLGGRGLTAQAGASLSASGIVVAEAGDWGAIATGVGSTLTLEDAVVQDTHENDRETIGGFGVQVQRSGLMELRRALLRRNHSVAVRVTGQTTEPGDPPPTFRAEDLVVRDTLPTDDVGREGTYGRGMSVVLGARAEVSRALFEGNLDVAVFTSEEGSAIELTDVVIRGTQSRVSDGSTGHALQVQRWAGANITRALFEENRGYGFVAIQDATAHLSALVIDTVHPVACGETTCPDAVFGMGIGVYERSAVDVSDFIVRDASLCGVHIVGNGGLDLAHGEVRGSPIGVCLQSEGYDVSRLQSDVSYVGNGINLQATTLPVPEAALPAGGIATEE